MLRAWAIAAACVWTRIAAAEPTPVEDLLASRAFLEGCLGSDGGAVLIVGDSLYERQQERIVERVRMGIREAGGVGDIVWRTVERWEAPEVCAQPLDAWPADGERPRVILFLALRRGDQDRVSSAELVIRRADSCKSAIVRRGGRADVCEAPRPARATAAPAAPSVPRPRAVRRDEGASPAIGLLSASAAFMGVAIGMRMVRAESGDAIAGSFATGMSLASSSLAIGAGTSLGVEGRFSRRQLAARGVSGAMFLIAGIMTIVAVRFHNDLDHPGEALLHGLGEAASAAGAGLVSATIAGLRLRPAIRASLRGGSIELRF